MYFTILVGIILVNNYVLAQFLGICPFLGVSKKLDSSVGMGVAVIFVMVLATAATWPIMQVLNKLEIGYSIYTDYSCACSVCRNGAQKIHTVASQSAWCISAADNYKLCGFRSMYFKY